MASVFELGENLRKVASRLKAKEQHPDDGIDPVNRRTITQECRKGEGGRADCE